MYEYKVLENKNPKKLLVMNSNYAATQHCCVVAYPRGAILAPRPRGGEAIPRLGIGLRRGVGSLRCDVGAQ